MVLRLGSWRGDRFRGQIFRMRLVPTITQLAKIDGTFWHRGTQMNEMVRLPTVRGLDGSILNLAVNERTGAGVPSPDTIRR